MPSCECVQLERRRKRETAFFFFSWQEHQRELRFPFLRFVRSISSSRDSVFMRETRCACECERGNHKKRKGGRSRRPSATAERSLIIEDVRREKETCQIGHRRTCSHGGSGISSSRRLIKIRRKHQSMGHVHGIMFERRNYRSERAGLLIFTGALLSLTQCVRRSIRSLFSRCSLGLPSINQLACVADVSG